MATIPIEVIVQDPSDPITPTPETNSTETNIAVPDTGAGTIGNSAFSNSSVASIIVPAVLLILVLAAICTLLMHLHHKRPDSKASKKEKLLASASATIAVLSATALLGNLIMPATKAATSDAEVSIEVPDKISIVVNREDDTTEATTETTAYVTSTSAFGYKVLLSMAEGVDTANLYLDGDIDSEYYITPVEGEELKPNTWGYTLANEGAYSAVPLVDTPATIAEDADLVEDKALFTHYSVNIDKSLPAGAYTGELEYSIDAKPVPTAIGALTYMQDFAKLPTENKVSVLASMREGEQYILKDIRDKKPYYISKLADGNVWMTQNLDFDIVAGEIYTPNDTDILSDWISEVGTTTDSSWASSNIAPQSYDPGDLYWNGEISESFSGTIEDLAITSGDKHFHIGNYYNWTASAAMNNSSSFVTANQDANQSICPAGWRLPVLSGNKSYQNLVSLQNIAAGTSGNIQNSPVYFVYGGVWTGDSAAFAAVGGYWSSIVTGDTNSGQMLFYYYGQLSTQASQQRSVGYLIRCLAR